MVITRPFGGCIFGSNPNRTEKILDRVFNFCYSVFVNKERENDQVDENKGYSSKTHF